MIADLRRDPVATRRWLTGALIFALLVIVSDRLLSIPLRGGLDRYYGLDQDNELLLVGHSRTVLGIDEELLEKELGVPVSKYAFAGANINDRDAMTRHYISTRKTPPKVVVYDVDGSMFSTSELSVGSYTFFFPYWDEAVPNAHIREFAPKDTSLLPLAWFHLTRYDEALLALSYRGWADMRANLKSSTINLNALQNRIKNGKIRPMTIEDGAVATFESTLAYCKEHNVRVVLAYIWTVDVLNNVNRAAHDEVIAKIKSYADASDTVDFFDYNTANESRHELFFDGIHLNQKGSREITALLAQDLRPLLADQ